MENNKIFAKRQCLSRSELLDFVAGNMTDAEQHEIENHLLDCPLCESAIDSLNANPQLLIALPSEYPGVKSELAKKRSVIGIPFIMRWAAALLIPIVAGFAVYFYTKSNDYKSSLTMEVAPLPPEQLVTRGEQSEQNSSEDLKASHLYQLADYKKAAEAYKVLLANEPDNENYMLYLGISLLLDKQLKEAIPNFESLRFNSAKYYEPASWYLAISNIQLNENDNARLLLQELAAKQGDYTEKAQEMLKQIAE